MLIEYYLVKNTDHGVKTCYDLSSEQGLERLGGNVPDH